MYLPHLWYLSYLFILSPSLLSMWENLLALSEKQNCFSLFLLVLQGFGNFDYPRLLWSRASLTCIKTPLGPHLWGSLGCACDLAKQSRFGPNSFCLGPWLSRRQVKHLRVHASCHNVWIVQDDRVRGCLLNKEVLVNFHIPYCHPHIWAKPYVALWSRRLLLLSCTRSWCWLGTSPSCKSMGIRSISDPWSIKATIDSFTSLSNIEVSVVSLAQCGLM